MTYKQHKWAAPHDWYRHSDLGAVVCYDSETDDLVRFSDFDKLREWAGY